MTEIEKEDAYLKSLLAEAIIHVSKNFDHKAFRDHIRKNPDAFRLEGIGTVLNFAKPKGCIVERFKGKKKKIRTNKKCQ